MLKQSAQPQRFASKRVFSVSEAAEYLGVSPITLRRWEASGKLPTNRTLGGQRRYTKGQLDAINAGFKNHDLRFKNGKSQTKTEPDSKANDKNPSLGEGTLSSPIVNDKQSLSLASANDQLLASETTNGEIYSDSETNNHSNGHLHVFNLNDPDQGFSPLHPESQLDSEVLNTGSEEGQPSEPESTKDVTGQTSEETVISTQLEETSPEVKPLTEGEKDESVELLREILKHVKNNTKETEKTIQQDSHFIISNSPLYKPVAFAVVAIALFFGVYTFKDTDAIKSLASLLGVSDEEIAFNLPFGSNPEKPDSEQAADSMAYLPTSGGTLEGEVDFLDSATFEELVLFKGGAKFGTSTLNISTQGAISSNQPISTTNILSASQLIISGNPIIGTDGKIPSLSASYFASLDGSQLTNISASHLNGLAASSFLRSDESDTAEGSINFTADPGSSHVSGSPVYINPGAAQVGYTLFGVAVNGEQRFKINSEGDIEIARHTEIDGNTTLGDSSSDLITPNGSFYGSLVPAVDNQFNLGSESYAWNNLYIDGGINGSGTWTISNTNPTLAFVDTTAGEDDWNVNVDGSSFILRNTTDGSNYLTLDGSGALTLVAGATVQGLQGLTLENTSADLTFGNGESINNDTNGTLQLVAATVNTSGNVIVSGTSGLIFNGVGGDITFTNGEKIDNDTDGTLTITSPTISFATTTTLNANSLTSISATSLTSFTGGATAIDFTEFDVSASTGSVTINDTGDAGALFVEGTSLDINSLDFVGLGTITAASGQVLAINTTSATLALSTTTSGDITLTTGAAAGLINLLTGNLKVGNGTPGVSLNGEDAYITGTLEVDGSTQFDGAVTFNSTSAFDSLTVGGGYGSTGVTISSAGNLQMNGNLTVDGSASFGGIVTNSSNTTLGDSAADTITFVGVINSNVVPDNSTRNFGSASSRWSTGYFDTVSANNISGTVVTGATSNNDWTINSDNSTANAETATLTFERGTPIINAVLQWNASGDAGRVSGYDDNFLFNFPISLYSQVSGVNQTFTSGSLFNYGQNATHAITQTGAFIGTNFDFSSNITVPNSSSGNQTGNKVTLKDGGASATAIGFQTAGTLDIGIDLDGTFGTAEIRLSNDETISNLVDGTVAITASDVRASGDISIPQGNMISLNGSTETVMIYNNTVNSINGIQFEVPSGQGFNFRQTGTGSLFSINSSGAASFAGSVTTGGQILASDGTAAAPGYAFSSRTNDGIYGASNLLGFTLGGVERVRLASENLVLRNGGSYTWSSGAIGATVDLILARDAANTLALRNSTNAQLLRIYNTYTDASNYERLNIGWSANESYVNTVANGTGISRPLLVGTAGTGSLFLWTNATKKWEVNSSGHFLAVTDNTYDIGASGATRPRNLYVGTDGVFGGDITVSGGDLLGTGDESIDIGEANTDQITFRINNTSEVGLASTGLYPSTSDGSSLGFSTNMWSDLFLASGAVVNFNNGDVTMTHSSNTLTVSGGNILLDSSAYLGFDSNSHYVPSDGSFGGILNSPGAFRINIDSNNNGAAGATEFVVGHNQLTGDATANVLFIVDDSGFLAINDTSNANMTQGLTINQGANDDEILSLKSSDVAHGITNVAETDTYGFFKKYSATDGALWTGGIADTGSTGLFLSSAAVTDNTTKSTSGAAYIMLQASKKNGVGLTSVGANGNLVGITNDGSTQWLVDAEGDVWQNGDLTVNDGDIFGPSGESFDLGEFSADTITTYIASSAETTLTSSAFSPASSDGSSLGTSSLMWSDLFLASGAVTNWNNGDVTLTHSTDTLTFAGANAIAITSGVSTGTGTTSGLSLTANSLTTGTALYLGSTSITSGKFFDINNGSSIFSISNTDITTSLPVNFNSTGDVNIAYDLNFTNQTSSFIKSNAPLTIEAGESFESNDLTLKTFNSGDVVFDAAGGLTSVQAQTWTLNASSTSVLNITNSAGTTIFNIDSTNNRVGIGDSAPSKLLELGTATSGQELQFQTSSNSILGASGLRTNTSYQLTTESPDSMFFHINTDGGAVTDDYFGFLNLSGGTELARLTDDGMFLLNDTTNANMTQGLTINQGANDDEIFALKSSDVAHGITTDTETDTYGFFKKASSTAGGLWSRGFSETTTGLYLEGSHTTDNTTKSTSGIGAVILAGNLKSGTTVTSLGTDANIVTIRNNTSTQWLVDAEGDVWQNGDLTVNGGNAAIGTSVGTSALLVSGSVGDHLSQFTYTGSTNTAAAILAQNTSTASITTKYGINAQVTGANGTNNIAGYFNATNGTNNYGLIVENGSVGIGTTSPGEELHLSSATPVFRIQDSDNGAGAAATPLIEFGKTAGGVWSRSGYIGDGFSGAERIGILSESGADIGFYTNGVTTSRWSIDTSGNFLATTDNTHDIGASGATRPRSLYLGSSLNVSGVSGATSSITSTAPTSVGLTITNNSITNANGRILHSTGTSTSTSGTNGMNYFSSTFSPAGASTADYFGIYAESTLTTANGAGAGVTGIRGIGAYSVSSGTLANAYGVRGVVASSTSGGIITNGYALYAENSVATGTITTGFGLYVADQTSGGSDYGIYIAGADTYALYAAADDVAVLDDLWVGATSETITHSSYAVNGDDVFIADSLGVEGTIFTDSGININNSAFSVASTGLFGVAPTTTGTIFDIALETEWTAGTIINADYASGTGASGDIIGINLDFNTSFTGAADSDLTGFRLTTPPLTSTGTATTTYTGVAIPTAGALTQNTAAGTINWRGASITMPNITQSTGTITSQGILIANGTITTGGTQHLINLAGAGVGAGSLNALNIGGITAGSGTEHAIAIGAGWDVDINATTSLEVGIGGANEVTLTSSAFSPAASDGNALGTTSLMWSDLFLASGGVANFNNGDVTLTHSTTGAGVLTVAGGQLAVSSFADPGGGQTTLSVTSNIHANNIPAINHASTTTGTGNLISFFQRHTAATNNPGANNVGFESAFTLNSGISIQSFAHYQADAPTISGTSVGTMYGYYASNQGATGVTNAYGVYIAAQSGAATTNIGLYNAGTSTLVGTITTSTITTASGNLTLQTASHGSDVVLGSNYLVAKSGGDVVIGSSTGNANMTTGLTINQGAADDNIFDLKSSDIAHGVTGQSETDTYFRISKNNSTLGGAFLQGLGENTSSVGINLGSVAGAANTTKSTSGFGAIYLNSSLVNGTGITTLGSDANIASFANNGTTNWIVDAEGDVFQKGYLYPGNQSAMQSTSFLSGDADGIGVGLQNPDTPLHVSNGGVANQIKVQSPTADGTAGIVWQNDATTFSWQVNGNDSDKFKLWHASTERLSVSTVGAFAFTSGTTTGTGTSSALSLTANSLTTGTALYLASTSITSGKFLDINNGSSIFSISNTDVTTSLPTNFTSSGDVSIAYDLNFTNPTASYIGSSAPLYVRAGETFGSSNLTLQTYNSGDIVFDTPGGVTLAQAQEWRSNVSSTSAVNITNSSGTTLFNIDSTNGRVGLGTATPSYPLHVKKDTASTAVYSYFENSANAGGVGIGVLRGSAGGSAQVEGILDAAASGDVVRVGAVSNHNLNFITNNGTKMTLNTSGQLAIPTTGTSAGLVLGTTNTVTLNDSSTAAERAGTARRTYKVTLVPEFEGATLTPDDTSGTGHGGDMVSDFCSKSNTNPPDRNTDSWTGGVCHSAGDIHNYYKWTTNTTGTNDYDIWIPWQVPSDFHEFANSSAITFNGWRSDNDAGDLVSLYLYADNDTACGDGDSIDAAANTWDAEVYDDPTGCDTTSGGAIDAGDVVYFRVALSADDSGGIAAIGEITINYLSKWK